MSEEEKKLFEAIKYKNKHLFLVKVDADFLINLIEKQQKELNNLKEIEQSHKEENGKLRVELEQEKEKNKELEEKLKIAKQLYNDACVCIATDCVEKDKIKAIVDEHIPKQPNIITGEIEYTPNANANSFLVQDILELLEGK